MRILITGGKGELATALCNALENDHQVIAPSRIDMDVTICESVDRYLGSQPIDCVIHAAGSIHPRRLEDSNEEEWIKDFEVNVFGPYKVAKRVLKSNQKCVMIFIASMAAFAYYRDWASYCASKAAILSFSKCLATDGYESYCICPGGFRSKLRSKVGRDDSDLMPVGDVVECVKQILASRYKSGDVIAMRKRFFSLNPTWIFP